MPKLAYRLRDFVDANNHVPEWFYDEFRRLPKYAGRRTSQEHDIDVAIYILLLNKRHIAEPIIARIGAEFLANYHPMKEILGGICGPNVVDFLLSYGCVETAIMLGEMVQYSNFKIGQW